MRDDDPLLLQLDRLNTNLEHLIKLVEAMPAPPPPPPPPMLMAAWPAPPPPPWAAPPAHPPWAPPPNGGEQTADRLIASSPHRAAG